MIVAVTGAPGAGKTFYAIRTLTDSLRTGKFVATNVTLEPDWERRLAHGSLVGRLRGDRREESFWARGYVADDLDDLMRVKLGCTVCGAEKRRDCGHGHGFREGRGVAVIDEAHDWLNSRTWDRDKEQRARYVGWFSKHRHLGWDVYVLTQHLDSLDKQLRDRVEFQVVLRNLRNAKIAGLPVVPFNCFLAIWVWLGGPTSKRHIAKRELYLLDHRRKLYDTHGLADLDVDDGLFGERVVLPRSRPATGAPKAPGAGEPTAA